MRILLDESVPVQICKALSGHEVSTAVEMGWQGIANSEVADKNFQHQQDLSGRKIAVLDVMFQ